MNINFKSAVKTVSIICVASIMAGTMTINSFAKSLDEAIAGDHRSDKNKARDKYRHPKETLEFFGLKENMSVVEIWPGGGGWYQEILAPYLHDSGTYYSAGRDLSSTSEYVKKTLKKVSARLASDPALYGKVIVTELAPPEKLAISPAGTVDMVLSFRNFHNWQMGGYEKDVLKAIFMALKPGGVFGVTDHRSETTNGKDGYIKPADLLAAAKEAGFILAAKSEINANSKDDHNHVKGVWTLPPRLAGDKADHDKMKAIGESDRLTYKFMKPAK